jgi:hypothetical protein
VARPADRAAEESPSPPAHEMIAGLVQRLETSRRMTDEIVLAAQAVVIAWRRKQHYEAEVDAAILRLAVLVGGANSFAQRK